jgi:hypothetical protein
LHLSPHLPPCPLKPQLHFRAFMAFRYARAAGTMAHQMMMAAVTLAPMLAGASFIRSRHLARLGAGRGGVVDEAVSQPARRGAGG